MITLEGRRPAVSVRLESVRTAIPEPRPLAFSCLVRIRQILARPGPAAGGARSAGRRQAGQQRRYRGAAQPLAAQGITVGLDEAAPDAMLAGAAPGP
jgi:hypothetical protein